MRECAFMSVHLQVCCTVVLLGVVSGHQVAGQETHRDVNKQASARVFLTASEKKGSPAVLDPSRLRVLIDKQVAGVTTVRSASADSLLFGLLVDTSNSNSGSVESEKKASLQLFQALSDEGNKGYLVFFNHLVAISGQPLDVPQVKALLERAEIGGGTAIYDALTRTCSETLSWSRNPGSPRRAIVLVSDGDDDASRVTRVEAKEACEKQGVAVFSLVRKSVSHEGSRGEHDLKEISHDTGGDAIIRKELTDGVAPLLSAIKNQWVLELVPANPADQQLHSLEIKTSQKDVHISFPSRILLQ